MNRVATYVLLAWGLFAVPMASAGEWDVTGFAGLDNRAFWLDGQFPEQQSSNNVSFLAQPEFYWRSDSGDQRLSVVAFGRLDSHDSERTHADLREAYWGYGSNTWDFTVGFNKVFWGVTESRHLVDVVNQSDLVEDIDQEDKLGQPMLNLNLQREFGEFGFFVMPYFRERTFPGAEGRLRTPLPVDTDNPIYESEDGQQHVDYAFRYSHYLGDLDIGVSAFDGTSREPTFVLSQDGTALLPVYEQMSQVGMDMQYTKDAWLWKFEAIARDTTNDSFAATVAGVEYTLYGLRGGNSDLGLLVEYLYDGRNSDSPPTAFDNDVFIGVRLAMNDAADTSVLAGIAMDADIHETFFNLEAERRFGDSLSAGLRVRAFANAGKKDPLYAFDRDDYVQLRLSWYY